MRRPQLSRAIGAIATAVVPVVLALAAASLILLAMGKDPLAFFARVVQYGVLGENWMRSLVLLAPLLLIAVGLIVAFRGQLWNLGYAGQFLLGAVVVSGVGPHLFASTPSGVGTVILLVAAAAIGAVWALVPALLKARFGTNEIVTSLVMSFIGIGVVNLLIKGPFKDQTVPQPQTQVLRAADMLPYLGSTTIHVGLVLALLVALIVQVMLQRTPFGLRVDVFGVNRRAARHVGIHPSRMILALFALSGALIGLAGGVDMLGHESYQRADWNPHYGDAVMPFVFLARLSPLAAIPLLLFYAILATGGTLAAQQSGLNVDFLLVIVGLILLFMTLTEAVAQRRAGGHRYLPAGLRRTLTALFPGGDRSGAAPAARTTDAGAARNEVTT